MSLFRRYFEEKDGNQYRGVKVNKTKIEWCDYTWSPITGCTRGCDYCYARKMAQRLKGRAGYPEDDPFQILLHCNRLDEPKRIKTGKRIFTVSMGDMFDPNVKPEWIRKVYDIMVETPQHRYMILTKAPYNIPRTIPVPDNCWIGVSVTRGYDYNRLRTLSQISSEMGFRKRTFTSIEPLHGSIEEYPDTISNWVPPLVIIGAETGNRWDKIKATRENLVDWVYWAVKRGCVNIFYKDSLITVLEEIGEMDNQKSSFRMRRDIPKELIP